MRLSNNGLLLHRPILDCRLGVTIFGNALSSSSSTSGGRSSSSQVYCLLQRFSSATSPHTDVDGVVRLIVRLAMSLFFVGELERGLAVSRCVLADSLCS